MILLCHTMTMILSYLSTIHNKAMRDNFYTFPFGKELVPQAFDSLTIVNCT